MKRVVASQSAKSYGGRSWNELIMQLDRAGYLVDSAYRDHPHKWIEVIKDGRLYDAEVTPYEDGSYEVMEYNIYQSNHSANDSADIDPVDQVISKLGDIIDELSAYDDEQSCDIRDYLTQVSENIEQYRSRNYE